jgi:hypothetical protein
MRVQRKATGLSSVLAARTLRSMVKLLETRVNVITMTLITVGE